jgi:hypothetical protein
MNVGNADFRSTAQQNVVIYHTQIGTKLMIYHFVHQLCHVQLESARVSRLSITPNMTHGIYLLVAGDVLLARHQLMQLTAKDAFKSNAWQQKAVLLSLKRVSQPIYLHAWCKAPLRQYRNTANLK